MCGKEFGGVLNPQVISFLPTAVLSTSYFRPHCLDNCGILTLLWSCLLSANAKLPTCKIVSQGRSLELFGEQPAGVREKAVYASDTAVKMPIYVLSDHTEIGYMVQHFFSPPHLPPTFILISAVCFNLNLDCFKLYFNQTFSEETYSRERLKNHGVA